MRVLWTACALTALSLGCVRAPEDVVRRAARAIEEGDLDALRRHIAPGYADARGDRARLFEDLEHLIATSAMRKILWDEPERLPSESGRTAVVEAHLELQWVGPPNWRVYGPDRLELVRQDDFRIEGGVLVAFRETEALVRARRAALEANDAEGLRVLLHPDYRDGDLDADEAIHRLAKNLEQTPVRLRPTNYRLELRGSRAHLDEHYVLAIGPRTLPPAIARFTLEKTAGRLRIVAGLYPHGQQLEPRGRSH